MVEVVPFGNLYLEDGDGDFEFDINNPLDQVYDQSGNLLTTTQAIQLNSEFLHLIEISQRDQVVDGLFWAEENVAQAFSQQGWTPTKTGGKSTFRLPLVGAIVAGGLWFLNKTSPLQVNNQWVARVKNDQTENANEFTIAVPSHMHDEFLELQADEQYENFRFVEKGSLEDQASLDRLLEEVDENTFWFDPPQAWHIAEFVDDDDAPDPDENIEEFLSENDLQEVEGARDDLYNAKLALEKGDMAEALGYLDQLAEIFMYAKLIKAEIAIRILIIGLQYDLSYKSGVCKSEDVIEIVGQTNENIEQLKISELADKFFALGYFKTSLALAKMIDDDVLGDDVLTLFNSFEDSGQLPTTEEPPIFLLNFN